MLVLSFFCWRDGRHVYTHINAARDEKNNDQTGVKSGCEEVWKLQSQDSLFVPPGSVFRASTSTSQQAN